MDHSLFGLPWWGGLLVTIVLLIVAAEIGFRLGRRKEDPSGDRKTQIGVQVGAILALLGLLLAFSFSIVESRFATRKKLVIDDANAIGTTYLRAKLLPAPHSERILDLLRQYVSLRIDLKHQTPEGVKRALRRSAELHDELWAETVLVARVHPESEVVGRFITSLNEMIDLHTTRVMVALFQQLPPTILHVLIVVSILAMVLLGYGAGLGRWRAGMPVTALVAAVGAVLVLINQLDDPASPLFDVSQEAMVQLHESIKDQGPAKDSKGGRASLMPDR